MTRRDFLYRAAASSSSLLAPLALAGVPHTTPIDARSFHDTRRYADLPISRVAYIERGHGPVALFIHGYPLNGYQWRGALDRLQGHRRCIAPDMMGLGYTVTPTHQSITPETQVEMLNAFLDSLHIQTVDLVANDSGGLISQLFIARYPERVRTLLITNCDVDTDSPPPLFIPLINLADKHVLADRFLAPQVADKTLARSAKGLGGAYTYPDRLSDETIDIYLRPLVDSPDSKAQLEQYTASLRANPLPAIREDLRRWHGPTRIVWGMKDPFFNPHSADWLDQNLPGSRGVRRVEGANLFFPEEMPDLIAEEALALWNHSRA
jgi:pimeloyl-ACP methyl ester carboxylesterase